MKPLLVIALITFLSCKAQNPIVSLDTKIHETAVGSYLKDLNNELDKFEGTWEFVGENSSFIIVLEKKEQVYNDEWYEDMLIGEYKYIDNGVTTVDLLNRLSNPLLNNPNSYYEFNITGNTILKKLQKPSCEDCGLSERRLLLILKTLKELTYPIN